ncbi:MAG: phytanoyl-CoA dioxygenase [Rhodospirillaceae bacterium]|nr:phytanoyl-CoA dioxygenase [Rhodospirillaceae bacterium]|tara:strand:- start:698 stop:1513 length:816 start_codon:yes stop_codon:yes gene_type:complete
MTKHLTEEQVESFNRNGFISPMNGISAEHAAECRKCVEHFEEETGHHAQDALTLKAHLPYRTLSEVVLNERILDAVEDLIGPNILCWGSSMFVKDPGGGKFVSWHADTYYYGVEPANSLTLWVAFTPANPTTGCIKCIPGSHLEETEFENTPTADNILSRGQTTKDVDASEATFMPLEPGQFSIHHEKTVHSSEPNLSDDRRIGMSIHYCSTQCRQTKYAEGEKPFAALVRGVDEYGHWENEKMAELDYDAAAAKEMIEIRNRFIGRSREG